MPVAFFVLQYPIFPETMTWICCLSLTWRQQSFSGELLCVEHHGSSQHFSRFAAAHIVGNAVLEMAPPTFWMTDLTPTIVVWCVEPSNHTIEQFLEATKQIIDHIITLLQGVFDVSHMSEEFRGQSQTVDRRWRYWHYHALPCTLTTWQHACSYYLQLIISQAALHVFSLFSLWSLFVVMVFYVIIKHISNLHKPIKPGLEDLFIPLSKFIERHFCQFAKVSVKNWPLCLGFPAILVLSPGWFDLLWIPEPWRRSWPLGFTNATHQSFCMGNIIQRKFQTIPGTEKSKHFWYVGNVKICIESRYFLVPQT